MKHSRRCRLSCLTALLIFYHLFHHLRRAFLTTGPSTAAHAPQPSPLANDLLVSEYQSLRVESAYARRDQIRTLQFSLAGIAAIVAATGLIPQPKTFADVVNIVLIYGLAIPLIALIASLVYIGEMFRMERAGYYLRGLEREVASFLTKKMRPHPSLSRPYRSDDILLHRPLFWETFISSRWAKRTLGRKLRIPYLGGTGLYFSAITGSVTYASYHSHTSIFISDFWEFILIGIGIAIIFATLVIYGSLARSLFILGARSVPLSDLRTTINTQSKKPTERK